MSAAAVVAIALANAAPARAQANRTFVSAQNGSDSNGCTFNNPCQTFAAALAVTNAKGEIVVLDPGEYGTVTISRAVSIVNDGVGVASITAISGTAITINAGASDVVNLRGLTLTGAGTNGAHGINFQSGGGLNIQNCVIRGFPQAGIFFAPLQSGSALTVLDTVVSNSGRGGQGAIVIAPNGAMTANVYLGRVQVSGSGGWGIGAAADNLQPGGSLAMTIADSVVTANPNGFGVNVSAGTNSATATLINTRLTNNEVGLLVGSGVTAYLAETVISGNTSNGFSGGTIKSFGNNRITDTNNSGSLTAIAKQ